MLGLGSPLPLKSARAAFQATGGIGQFHGTGKPPYRWPPYQTWEAFQDEIRFRLPSTPQSVYPPPGTTSRRLARLVYRILALAGKEIEGLGQGAIPGVTRLGLDRRRACHLPALLASLAVRVFPPFSALGRETPGVRAVGKVTLEPQTG